MTTETLTQEELLHQRLDALVGTDPALHTKWLQSCNLDLQGVPQDLMRTQEGATQVLAYLEAVVRPDAV